jgi:hypothetical protein
MWLQYTKQKHQLFAEQPSCWALQMDSEKPNLTRMCQSQGRKQQQLSSFGETIETDEDEMA